MDKPYKPHPDQERFLNGHSQALRFGKSSAIRRMNHAQMDIMIKTVAATKEPQVILFFTPDGPVQIAITPAIEAEPKLVWVDES